ncbi:uncharacterized protein LOC100280183 [Zea mays]|uniref:Uncharacterized protein n=1 Tax=Zea mays TaxID=4577 RepID=B8A2D5_MAIZE|nr:uncharacterized protein LOC100280183 [Zea mays]ACL54334.1 unknown [Zea mays]|eukprot:NP_001146587.1 uncharacterized protein LOC100280183 [Zea mays]
MAVAQRLTGLELHHCCCPTPRDTSRLDLSSLRAGSPAEFAVEHRRGRLFLPCVVARLRSISELRGIDSQASATKRSNSSSSTRLKTLSICLVKVVHIATTAQEKTKSWKETSRSSKTTTSFRYGLAATPSQLPVKALSLLRFASTLI